MPFDQLNFSQQIKLIGERLKVFNTRSHPGLDKPKKNICKNVWVSKLNLECSIIIKIFMKIILQYN